VSGNTAIEKSCRAGDVFRDAAGLVVERDDEGGGALTR
jgi:hypothetical protein